MSIKFNWRKAQLHGKRSISCLDEQEYRDKDAAARWLERNETAQEKQSVWQPYKPSKKKRKKSFSPHPHPTEAVQQ